MKRFLRSCRLAMAGALAAAMAASSMTEASAEQAPAAAEAISVSPAVAADLARFRRVDLPGFFAISRDGRHSGFSLCRSQTDCDPSVADVARSFCEQASRGTPCVLFADKTRVLWPGKVNMPDPEDVDLAERRWYVLPATITWTGLYANARTWMLFPRGGRRSGWLKLARSAENSPCYGTYVIRTETASHWTLTCGPDAIGAGESERSKDGWRSRGRDESGRAIEIFTSAE